MDFKDAYPDYIAIEAHIRRARIERSLALAQIIADIAHTTIRGLKRIGHAVTTFKRGAQLPQWAREPAPHR